MTRSRHAVCDDRGKQGFNRPENRNRERRLENLAHHFQTDVRQMRRRKSSRNLVLRSNRHYAVSIVPAKNFNESGGEDNRNQGPRNLRRHFRPKDADQKGEDSHDDRIKIRRTDRLCVQGNLSDGVCGFGNSLRKMQSQKIRDLPECDDDGDARRKADCYRERDKFDDRSELCNAENDKHDARHERRCCKPVVAVFRNDSIDDDNECACRTADLETAPAEKGNCKARDNRRVEAFFRSHAARNSERNRQRKRQDADNQTGHQIFGEKLFGITFAELLKKLRHIHLHLWHKCRQR